MDISVSQSLSLLLLLALFVIGTAILATIIVLLVVVFTLRTKATFSGLIAAFVTGTLAKGLRQLATIAVIVSSVITSSFIALMATRILDIRWSTTETLLYGVVFGVFAGFIYWKGVFYLITRFTRSLRNLNPFDKNKRNQNILRVFF